MATLDEVIDDWFAANCPKSAVSMNSRRARTKSAKTITRPVSTLRRRRIKPNPVADVLLPTARPPRQRKSLTIEQVQTLLTWQSPRIRARRCG